MGITSIVAYLVVSALRIIEMLLLARAILSWFPNLMHSPISSFVYYTTEPILAPIRKMLRGINALRNMPIDFSLLAAYFIIEILLGILVRFT